jgi:hypothetical protein
MLYGTQWWQIALAVLAYFAIGALWYSPALFGRQWARELGKKMGEMGDPRNAMIVTFLAMVLLILIEACFVSATATDTPLRGAFLGAKLWLGFVATTALINNVFQNGSRRLYLIDQGYHLVGLVLAGALLAL